jgi:hypothetical protein
MNDHFVIIDIAAPSYVRKFSPPKAMASEQMRGYPHPPSL